MESCDVLITEQVNGEAIDELKEKYEVYYDPELWSNQKEFAKRLATSRAVIVRNQTCVREDVLSEARGLCDRPSRSGIR